MLFKLYLRLIGKLFGEDRQYEEPDLDPYDFQSSPLVDAGITWIHFLKRLLVPTSARTAYGCPYLCTVKPPPDCPERGQLQDYINLFITSTDESILLTLDGLTPEFWLPGTIVPFISSIENELKKELDDIFGEEITFVKVLSLTRFTGVISKSLTHFVLLLQCNTEQKKNVKNSKKYRGKLRWIHNSEFLTKLNITNCKSPELLYYFYMYKNTYNYKPLSYEGLKSDAFGTSNVFEISENVLIKEKSPITDFIESNSININAQIDIYKRFFIICYPAIYMSKDIFSKLYYESGWTKTDANALFVCADTTKRGGLSFRDFLCIYAVTEPSKSSITSNDIRNKYIFRFFDNDRDNFLNTNEYKQLLTCLKRYKNQLVNDTLLMREIQATFKSFEATKLSYKQYEELVTQNKLRDTNLLLRSGQSIKQILTKQSLEKMTASTSNHQLQSNRSQFQQKSTLKSQIHPSQDNNIIKRDSLNKGGGGKLMQKYAHFNVALHTLIIGETGTFINAEEIWNIEDAISDSVLKVNSNLENQQMIKTSNDTFDKNSTCNEVLRWLHFLYEINQNTYTLRKKDSYQWGNVNKISFVNNLYEISNMVQRIFTTESRLINLTSPSYIIGDLHGNFASLLKFENSFWSLGPLLCPATLLFLGDYVDRGLFSLEVAIYLLTYKVLNPTKVILIRGNHEIREIQKMFTFLTECMSKLGEELGRNVWECINKAFDMMPLAAAIDSKIFCCHGGIPPPWLCPVIAAINKIPIVLTEPNLQSPLAWEMMWNDPVRTKQLNEDLSLELDVNDGFAYNSKRGTAHVFNKEALEKFLAVNGFSHMIRAHEVATAGFLIHHNCKLFTVFSSSEYCGGQNEAACILVHEGKIRVLRLNRKCK